MANNQIIGRKGEDLATVFLIENGYIINERNYRSRFGEIDIIATKEHTTVFFEVKTRTSSKYGQGAEAVNYYKQKHIHATAMWYVKIKELYNSPLRMDIIEVHGKEIRHIMNAFEM